MVEGGICTDGDELRRAHPPPWCLSLQSLRGAGDGGTGSLVCRTGLLFEENVTRKYLLTFPHFWLVVISSRQREETEIRPDCRWLELGGHGLHPNERVPLTVAPCGERLSGAKQSVPRRQETNSRKKRQIKSSKVKSNSILAEFRGRLYYQADLCHPPG